MAGSGEYKNISLPDAPDYRGGRWLPVRLPETARDWSFGGEDSVTTDSGNHDGLIKLLRKLVRQGAWRWPKCSHYFFTDLHADADAFAASLVASGGIEMTGPAPADFRLSAAGREAKFVIGGDCFDKGPSSLELLRCVRTLIDTGARVRILAGNHDVRVLLGMCAVGPDKNVSSEHFFVRTGPKIIPLLREVWDECLKNGPRRKGTPSEKDCRKLLFPRESWFEEFPRRATSYVLPAQLEWELEKVREKMANFERLCGAAGLDLRQVYAATVQWKKIFLEKGSEFQWFFKTMRLCFRSGSLLFIHAGIDDAIAKRIRRDGIAEVNRSFRVALRDSPYEFYFSSLCNGIRTKYRDVDRPFTRKGVDDIRSAGITAIIHGHRPLRRGQRLSLRRSMINFECDTTLDRHTRRLEEIEGRGASVTIIEPNGRILGISSDFPHIKVFQPEVTLRHLEAARTK